MNRSQEVELERDMAAYGRIIVVAPRIDAVPNPFPGEYELVSETGYVELVGFIYLFARPTHPNG